MREIVSLLLIAPRRVPAILLSCLLALSGEAALGVEPTVVVTVAQSGDVLIVDATMNVQVPLATAWAVLTDFDHMTVIVGNLTSSKVTSRDGNTWIVRQEGVARYGLLSFPFQSEREIRLDPMRRILARNLSGTLKGMESEAKILPVHEGVQITYHTEIVPDSLLARIFGAPFLRHEFEEQFLSMAREMARRDAGAEPAGSRSGSPTAATILAGR
jgi:hypothetical protein